MKYGADPSQDEVFLRELEQIILENLQNEQFSVELLAQIKGVSRSHLHRKLKRLKGQSISQFIREIKLNEAMKLLEADVANVSEIAYRVGFSSTSYFNTCFHAYYGFPPGEVKKRNQIGGDHDLTAIEDVSLKGKKSLDSERSIKPKALLFTGVALVALLLVVYFINLEGGGDQVVKRAPAIAILPLDHLSELSDQEYLTAGIHDALIGELGTLKGLRVISRTSTMRYQDSNLLIQEIAKELGVDVIVEGSVVITGDSLRLQLQLIEAFPQERHLWAQEYYRDVPNILSLQGNIIQDIAEAIEVRLTKEDKMRLSSLEKVDPETYKAYLRGTYFLNKSTPEEFQKGLDYLHQAIENDPANPHAYVGLAEGYIALLHGPNPSAIYWQRAKAAAIRAIKLDSTLAKAYATLAMIKLYHEGDWEGAELAFIKTNSINPNLAFNHFHYAWFNVIFGNMDKALEEQKFAKELDPLTTIYTADMGSVYYWLGQYDKAMVELNQALELDSAFGHTWWLVGNVYAQQGKYDQAIKAHSRAAEINPVWKWALANTYVISGDQKKALAIVEELKNTTVTPRIAFGLMLVYVALGDLDEAFRWLEFEPADVWVPWTRTWPGLEPLRNDPRYKIFLRKKNLPPLPTSAT